MFAATRQLMTSGGSKTKILAFERHSRRVQVIDTDTNTLESPAIFLPSGGSQFQAMLNRSKTKLCVLSDQNNGSFSITVIKLGIGLAYPAIRNTWPDAPYFTGDTVRSIPNFTYGGNTTGDGYEIYPGTIFSGFYVSENFAYVYRTTAVQSALLLTRININTNTVTDNYYHCNIMHNITGYAWDGLRSHTGGFGTVNEGVLGVTGVDDNIFVIMRNSIVRISDSAGGQPTHFSPLDTSARTTPMFLGNNVYRRVTGDYPESLVGYSLSAINSVDTWVGYQWQLYSQNLPTNATKILNQTLLPSTSRGARYERRNIMPLTSDGNNFFIGSGTYISNSPGTYKGDVISLSDVGTRLFALSHPSGSAPTGFGNYATVWDMCPDYKNEKIYFTTTDNPPFSLSGGDSVAGTNGVGCFDASTGQFISKLTNTTATAAMFTALVAIPA